MITEEKLKLLKMVVTEGLIVLSKKDDNIEEVIHKIHEVYQDLDKIIKKTEV